MANGMRELLAEARARVTPSRPIIAYCGSRAPGALAAQTLQELGFSNFRSMAGGFQAWQAESRPVEG